MTGFVFAFRIASDIADDDAAQAHFSYRTKEGHKGDRVVEQAKFNGPQIAGYPKAYHQTQT
jgi:hypothetical protein